MGWDVWTVIDAGGSKPVRVGESFNYTHNTNSMLRAVGIEWEKLHGKDAGDVAAVLRRGLTALRDDPARYEAMNPENGWGSYEGLCGILNEMIECFEAYPKAMVRVCL